VMRMPELPPRMLVIGGGYVACELAHVFGAYGTAITQVQRSATLLVREEPSIAERYTEISGRRFDLRTSTRVTSAERVGEVWRVELEGDDGVTSLVEAEAVLLAVGRTPNGADLGVEAGGVALDEDGFVVVDEHQRTTAPGTWALGDVCSHHMLKHVANHEARVVAHNLAVTLGRSEKPLMRSDHRFVPHAVFGHPQIASFGPTGAELERDGVDVVSYTQAYGDVAFGWAMEDTTGFLTVHAAPDGRVLAAHAIGPVASTLIQPLLQAASFGQHAHEVARGQYWIHPALAEVVENALLGLDLP